MVPKIEKQTTYVEDRVSREYDRAKDIAYVIWRVTRKMQDVACNVAKRELCVIFQVNIERVLEKRRVVEAVHRRERLLHLCDTLANAHRNIAQTGLEILGRCQVIRVRVRLPIQASHQPKLDYTGNVGSMWRTGYV